MTAVSASDLERLVVEAFPPDSILLVRATDEAGTGSACVGGKFTLVVVSDAFAGQSLLDRQRRVNKALEEPLAKSIHALTLKTWTVEEARKRGVVA